MKKLTFIALFTLVSVLLIALKNPDLLDDIPSVEYQTGDIIYQSSNYGQSKAVKLATHSKYSHVGMVLNTDSGVFVLEAVQPVQIMPINSWIARSKSKDYCLQRLLKNQDLEIYNEGLEKFIHENVGKNYDLLFEWSEDRLYCSELVWKVYKEVYGIELSNLKQLKDFDLTHPYVKGMLAERYGKTLPLEQSVVAPQDLYESNLLKIIVE